MRKVAEDIYGYVYGTAAVATSAVSFAGPGGFKKSLSDSPDDEQYLRLAGDVLADQTKEIVDHCFSGIITNIPNLVRHSRSPKEEAIPEYSERSGLRFQQWILDTCFRPYNQDWINYQEEIALRHTSLKKN